METRIEKRRRKRQDNIIKVFKFLIILTTFGILYTGIKTVNDNIIYLDYFSNPRIFNLNILERKLDLFGKSYFIDLKVLKKYP
ncbi:MAG: hypothetical protein GX968_01035 [Tissierellia bacterium]|nr:hypothetical protein [Tissierellia bacterium]